MTNTSAGDGHGFYDDVLYDYENLTSIQADDIAYDLIDNCKFYLEGIALTPISIVGIIGKYKYEGFQVYFAENRQIIKFSKDINLLISL